MIWIPLLIGSNLHSKCLNIDLGYHLLAEILENTWFPTLNTVFCNKTLQRILSVIMSRAAEVASSWFLFASVLGKVLFWLITLATKMCYFFPSNFQESCLEISWKTCSSLLSPAALHHVTAHSHMINENCIILRK